MNKIEFAIISGVRPASLRCLNRSSAKVSMHESDQFSTRARRRHGRPKRRRDRDQRLLFADPLGKFGSEFSNDGSYTQSGNCAQGSALRDGANYARRYIKATLSS